MEGVGARSETLRWKNGKWPREKWAIGWWQGLVMGGKVNRGKGMDGGWRIPWWGWVGVIKVRPGYKVVGWGFRGHVGEGVD